MSDLTALSALYDTTREIGLSDTLDQLLDNILARAQGLIGFDHCALMLYDKDREELSVQRARGYASRREEILELTLDRGEGLTGWCVEHRTGVRIGDVREDSRYVAGLPEARSNMAVPLIVGKEIAGAINVESNRQDAFTESHERLLTVLGAQAALAIVASQARERQRDQIEQLEALYRISRLATRHEDLDETLRMILEITQGIIPDSHVAILLLNDDRSTLRVRASRGYPREVKELEISLGQGITGRCVQTGEVILVSDVTREAGYIPGVPGGRSEIAIPLMAENEVIGVLDVETTQPHAYGKEEEQTLSVIARQVAAVIQTVRLHQEARRLSITDPLTGLHNRRHFVTQLEAQVERARRYREPLGLLLVDCDYLKKINDRFGHHCGDAALRRVGTLLSEVLRKTDEVARIGGDEFAALLLRSDESRAREAMGRIRSAFRDLSFEADGAPIELSVSAGIAFYPRDAQDAKTLLRRVDEALYHAKDGGRNQLAVYRAGGDKEVSGTPA